MKVLKATILKTGDIYQVNLDPTIGDEIRKKRPVIILNPGDLKNLKLAIVVPITNWNSHWENNPFFTIINPDQNNRLNKKSAIDCFQIRAVSHSRFIKKIGSIQEEQLDNIKSSLSLILNIDTEHCI